MSGPAVSIASSAVDSSSRTEAVWPGDPGIATISRASSTARPSPPGASPADVEPCVPVPFAESDPDARSGAGSPVSPSNARYTNHPVTAAIANRNTLTIHPRRALRRRLRRDSTRSSRVASALSSTAAGRPAPFGLRSCSPPTGSPVPTTAGARFAGTGNVGAGRVGPDDAGSDTAGTGTVGADDAGDGNVGAGTLGAGSEADGRAEPVEVESVSSDVESVARVPTGATGRAGGRYGTSSFGPVPSGSDDVVIGEPVCHVDQRTSRSRTGTSPTDPGRRRTGAGKLRRGQPPSPTPKLGLPGPFQIG